MGANNLERLGAESTLLFEALSGIVRSASPSWLKYLLGCGLPPLSTCNVKIRRAVERQIEPKSSLLATGRSFDSFRGARKGH